METDAPTTALPNLLAAAQDLLDRGEADAVIEKLRTVDAVNGNAAVCALLAQAFFQRGDSKGDVYSSMWFADRAVALGADDPQLPLIKAVGAFRREDFRTAVELLAPVASPDRPAVQRLYALALHFAGRTAAAEELLGEELPHVVADVGPLKKWGCVGIGLGGLAETRPAGAAAPLPSCALSKAAGCAASSKDLDWQRRNVPCQTMCPADTDIPAYLTAVYEGDCDAAYRINLRDNVFPAVLGRICARPCESDCRHGWAELGESVAICHSKRAGSDGREQPATPVVLDKIFPASGKRVAVVGGGVAGLTCARQLALYGHGVTVFERHHRAGGMMNQGIPTFRLPREHIDREIDQIRALGVEIRCGVTVGADIPVSRLHQEFDALVLAAGTLRPNVLDLPGKELQGIHHGLPWLLQANEHGDAEIGAKVVVIGGGFTAMDCARTALRLGGKLVGGGDWGEIPLTASGADVRVIYRRSVDEMLVTPGELEELAHEGIGLELLASPVAYHGEDGRVTAVRFIRNELGEPDADGRRRPQPLAGSEFEVPADLVLLATGQFPDTGWIDDAFQAELVEDGWLRSGENYCTSVNEVFAAGDYATGARSLIDAIGHAKNCAIEVDSFLTGERRIGTSVLIEDITATGRIREMDYVPRQELPTLALSQRTLENEVELGYDRAHGVEETQRCYRCHIKYEIDPDKCIYCDWCVKARAREDCIVKVSALHYGEHGEITGFDRAAGSEDTELIYINQDECIRCNQCVAACPVDAISIQKVTRQTGPVS